MPAYDNSDFLNTEQKTSYARGAYSVDYNMNLFSKTLNNSINFPTLIN